MLTNPETVTERPVRNIVITGKLLATKDGNVINVAFYLSKRHRRDTIDIWDKAYDSYELTIKPDNG